MGRRPRGTRRDGESLALWAPGWWVEAPDVGGTPARLPEWGGRRDVLRTHPHPGGTPAALVRSLVVPADEPAWLRFGVAAAEGADWELRVVVDGEVLLRRTIGGGATRWEEVALDLGRFAGRRLVVRLENAPDDWREDFAHWTGPVLWPAPGTASR